MFRLNDSFDVKWALMECKCSAAAGQRLTWLIMSLCVNFRWIHTNESIRSGMAVLDVTIPTGYWIQQQKLDAYILSKRVRNLQRARYQNNKVLFYFDFVSAVLFQQSFMFSTNWIIIFILSFVALHNTARPRRDMREFHHWTMVSRRKYVTLFTASRIRLLCTR